MKGLELSQKYYEEYGKEMIHSQFPELESVIAVGLVGSGSECLGYDDDISKDHDFEPGFCIFIPDNADIDDRTIFKLERAYAKLPNEFHGFKRQKMSPVGGNRHGVMRAGDFYESKTGRRDGNLSLSDWLSIPEHYLLEATNGKVFRDDEGSFSEIRARLMQMPEDVRIKKLAGNLLLMAQSGQYNFMRCVSHGESGAAQLALSEFVNSTMACAFLLGGRYMPFYKWRFRALRELPLLSGVASSLEQLLTTPNTPETANEKQFIIEEIASQIITVLNERRITKAICGDLEKHAYSVNDCIKDNNLRNAGILYGV